MLVNTRLSQENKPRFMVLKHLGKTPFLATCSRCHTKFFTPLDLVNRPKKAALHLRNQFAFHKCLKSVLAET